MDQKHPFATSHQLGLHLWAECPMAEKVLGVLKPTSPSPAPPEPTKSSVSPCCVFSMGTVPFKNVTDLETQAQHQDASVLTSFGS